MTSIGSANPLWPLAVGALMMLAGAASPGKDAAADKDGDPGYRHGWSLLWELQYPPDFEHFDYVDPEAPKGGTIRVPQMGTFDSFNGWIDRGRQAAGWAS